MGDDALPPLSSAVRGCTKSEPLMRVHFITDDDAVLEMIYDELQRLADSGGRLSTVNHRSYVQSEIAALGKGDSPDLLIFDSLCKLSGDDQFIDDSAGSIKLLRFVRSAWSGDCPIPIIVIARGNIEKFVRELVEDRHMAIWQPPAPGSLAVLRKCHELFASAVEALMQRDPNEIRQCRVAADVGPRLTRYKIKLGVSLFSVDKPYKISFEPRAMINEIKILRLRRGSVIVETWQLNLRIAGRRLYSLLLEDMFGREFLDIAKKSKEIFEFRFYVNLSNRELEDLFLLPFEVANGDDDEGGDNFFCTITSMARRSGSGPGTPFTDGQVRMLFVIGERGGVTSLQNERTGESFGVELDELEHVEEVVDFLQGLANDKRLERRLTIDFLDESIAKGSEFEVELKRRLSTNQYDIIQFYGHSYSKDDSTYLIGPGKAHQVGYAVSIRAVAEWIGSLERKTQIPRLVFLSSCQSASIRTAIEMASAGVQNVLGFRWDVTEEGVAKYMATFYTEFLENRKGITESFRQACVEARNSRRGDPLWASAIAIVNDWDEELGAAS
jgi:hypothetical protein